MKIAIRENTWLKRSHGMDFGWGNGYVAIPAGHPFYGKDYDEIHEAVPLEVAGGLTFAKHGSECLDWFPGAKDCWVVGFDTCHSWNTLAEWGQDEVELETLKLKRQLENLIGLIL